MTLQLFGTVYCGGLLFLSVWHFYRAVQVILLA
jgi:hypothetical protein